MEFIIEQAGPGHLASIMEIMKDGCTTVAEKSWFAPDDEEDIRRIFMGKGFVIGAWEVESREMAGYFTVVYPDKKDNMGKYAGLFGKELEKVVYMDSAAVKAKYRGNALQRKMLDAAQQELRKRLKESGQSCQYQMCTIHPENQFSLNNMRQKGFEIVGRGTFYGGLDRYVLCRKINL